MPPIGVTRVLLLAGRIDSSWFSPDAAERGTRLHSCTERYDRNESFDVPDGCYGEMDAYARFVAETHVDYGGPEWWARFSTAYGFYDGTSIERRVESTRLRCRGRIDRICRSFLGHPAIIDFKFGGKRPWHGEQLAGYNRLCPVGPRYTVHFYPTGRYEIVPHTDPVDDRRFLHDLALAHRLTTTIGDDEWKQPTRLSPSTPN